MVQYSHKMLFFARVFVHRVFFYVVLRVDTNTSTSSEACIMHAPRVRGRVCGCASLRVLQLSSGIVHPGYIGKQQFLLLLLFPLQKCQSSLCVRSIRISFAVNCFRTGDRCPSLPDAPAETSTAVRVLRAGTAHPTCVYRSVFERSSPFLSPLFIRAGALCPDAAAYAAATATVADTAAAAAANPAAMWLAALVPLLLLLLPCGYAAMVPLLLLLPCGYICCYLLTLSCVAAFSRRLLRQGAGLCPHYSAYFTAGQMWGATQMVLYGGVFQTLAK